jgi:hypothetical protein
MDERILHAIRQNREQILPYIENPEITYYPHFYNRFISKFCPVLNCAPILYFYNAWERNFLLILQSIQKIHQKRYELLFSINCLILRQVKFVEAITEIFFYLVETCDERAMLVCLSLSRSRSHYFIHTPSRAALISLCPLKFFCRSSHLLKRV